MPNVSLEERGKQIRKDTPLPPPPPQKKNTPKHPSGEDIYMY